MKLSLVDPIYTFLKQTQDIFQLLLKAIPAVTAPSKPFQFKLGEHGSGIKCEFSQVK